MDNAAEASENNLTEKYLVFYLENQLYALPGDQILEILNMEKITRVPNLPAYIKGVVNIRGEIIPLIDLKIRFGKSECAYDEKTCVILVRIENIKAGFIVDSVKDVIDIGDSALNAASALPSSERYVTDILNEDAQTILLLSAENILRAG
jgi:purine-binding chemotaxis protein CheW